MDKVYTIEEIKAIAIPIAKQYGIPKPALFGSYAGGNAAPGSDVDFLVDKGELRDFIALCELADDLEAGLHKNVDIFTYSSLSADFRRLCAPEVVLYDREK